MTTGAVTVPAYVTNTPTDHLHILTDSGAKGVIVSTRDLAERVLAAAGQAQSLGIRHHHGAGSSGGGRGGAGA